MNLSDGDHNFTDCSDVEPYTVFLPALTELTMEVNGACLYTMLNVFFHHGNQRV